MPGKKKGSGDIMSKLYNIAYELNTSTLNMFKEA